jgi:hypothetical protein
MTRTDPTVMPTDPDLQAAARFRDSQDTRWRSAAHRPQLSVVLTSPNDSRVHALCRPGRITSDCRAGLFGADTGRAERIRVFSTVPAGRSTDQS